MKTKLWHISYKAKTEHFADEITWYAHYRGTLAEAINWLYSTEKVIEIVDMYEEEGVGEMREQTIKVYTFDELSDSAKDRVRDDMYVPYWESYTDCAYEAMRFDLDTMFPNSDLKVQFDFSCTQGSGVNIYGVMKLTDAINALQTNDTCPLTDEQSAELMERYSYVEFMFSENYRYTYSMKFIDRNNDIEWNYTDGETDDNECLIMQVKRATCDFLEDIERKMYDEWVFPSDDDMDDFIRNFEDEYFSDGSVFKGV